MRYAIYSCEGFSREVLPIARGSDLIASKESAGDKIVFVDDDATKVGKIVNGIQVISFTDLKAADNRDRLISIGIADTHIRLKVANKCTSEGFKFFSIFDDSFTRGDNIQIGEGSIFCAHTKVTADAEIGRHFQCNIYSYVAHDCRIGDFVTFAPRVSCNGRVMIDDFAYIGTGALLKQGVMGKPLRIGRGAIVGMGSVVLKDVPPYAVVAGNPAKLIRTLRNPE